MWSKHTFQWDIPEPPWKFINNVDSSEILLLLALRQSLDAHGQTGCPTFRSFLRSFYYGDGSDRVISPRSHNHPHKWPYVFAVYLLIGDSAAGMRNSMNGNKNTIAQWVWYVRPKCSVETDRLPKFMNCNMLLITIVILCLFFSEHDSIGHCNGI